MTPGKIRSEKVMTPGKIPSRKVMTPCKVRSQKVLTPGKISSKKVMTPGENWPKLGVFGHFIEFESLDFSYFAYYDRQQ